MLDAAPDPAAVPYTPRPVNPAPWPAGDRALAPAAGEGAIVEELLRAGAHVTAVELDPWRVERLRARFPEATVIEGFANTGTTTYRDRKSTRLNSSHT